MRHAPHCGNKQSYSSRSGTLKHVRAGTYNQALPEILEVWLPKVNIPQFKLAEMLKNVNFRLVSDRRRSRQLEAFWYITKVTVEGKAQYMRYASASHV